MKKYVRLLFLAMVCCSILFGWGCPAYLSYDIVGSWMADAIVEGELRTAALTFIGDKESGTCTMTSTGEQYSGTYTVSKEDVDFSFTFQGTTVITFDGMFDDKDKMSGTGVSDWGDGAEAFTWSAVRKD